MGEIKSAWEIAMEKVEKLEKLSPEDLRRKQEEEYTLIGAVLANKYLGGLDQWQLEVELDKHSSGERVSLKEAVASKLAQAIELGNHERLGRIIEGISYLKQGEAVGGIGNEIEQVFQEYRQAEQKGCPLVNGRMFSLGCGDASFSGILFTALKYGGSNMLLFPLHCCFHVLHRTYLCYGSKHCPTEYASYGICNSALFYQPGWFWYRPLFHRICE